MERRPVIRVGEPPPNYRALRDALAGEPRLADADARPPERLLQAVWQAQRLRHDRLRTADGRRLRVLHPGFLNREAGPDFRGAVLQFDEEPAVSGDVEVDLEPGGWRAHAHAGNPAYAGVRLHVVWRAAGGTPGGPATLALADVLDAPAEELAAQLGPGVPEGGDAWLSGRCAAPLARRPAREVTELLRQAGLVRLAVKAAALRARARDAGWEQALWEALFRALGYKHNVWPMQRLAELRATVAEAVAAQGRGPLVTEAVWLGVAGLLPAAAGNAALRERWDIWWRARDALADVVLPPAVWRRGGVRPANHPQRRVALAARWLAEGGLPERLAAWFLRADAGPAGAASLRGLLEPVETGLWARRHTLVSRPLPRAVPWLGAQRVTDLAVNAVLPWLHARAGEDAALCRRAEQLFLGWPAAEDNAVLRLARARLLGAAAQLRGGGAAAQQGLLQVVHDFCAGTDALCSRCRFPDLVAAWRPAEALDR